MDVRSLASLIARIPALALACVSALAACGDDGSAPPDAAPDASTASTGCALPTTRPLGTAVVETIAFGGRDRTYRLRLPAGFDGTPRPLMFVLHGGFGTAEQIETNGAGFDAIADREGIVLVYPNGIAVNEDATSPLQRAQTWNGGTCCGPAVTQNIDDVGFLTEVIDRVEAATCVDTSRVFFTGMSNGAIMSYRMACERADRIRAIAPVAGSLLYPACTPARPVPLFHVHGTLDASVPYAGGTGCGPGMVMTPPIPDVVATWAGFNACTGTPATVFTEGDGTCVASGTCSAETILCSIDGGSHSWPGAGNNVDGCADNGAHQSTTFHASEAIWAFFARQ